MIYSRCNDGRTTWYLGYGRIGREAAREVRRELISRGFVFTYENISVDESRGLFCCGRLKPARVFRSKLIVFSDENSEEDTPPGLLYRAAREIFD